MRDHSRRASWPPHQPCSGFLGLQVFSQLSNPGSLARMAIFRVSRPFTLNYSNGKPLWRVPHMYGVVIVPGRP